MSLFLLVATLLFYARSFNYGFYFDDRSQILEGKLIRSWGSIGKIFGASVWQNVDTSRGDQNVRLDTYRPLFNLSLLLDYKKGGPSPWTFHSTNVLLHATVVVLLYLSMLALGIGGVGSFLCSLLFMVHPIILTPVNYVSARADSLCGIFCLASLLSLLSVQRAANARKKIAYACLAAFFYGAALLSKESGILLPLVFLPVLLAMEFPVKKKIWLFAGLIFTLATYLFFRGQALGAGKVLADSSHALRAMVNFPWIVLHFFKQMFWPTLAYPLIWYKPVGLSSIYLAWAVVFYALTMIGLVFLATFKKAKPALWAMMFCLGTLLPPIVAIVNTEVIDGHYLYMPTIGFVLFMAICLKQFNAFKQRTVALGFLVVISIAALRSFVVSEYFRHEISFYQAIMDTGRSVSLVHFNLGNSWFRSGHWNNAVETYDQYEKKFPPDRRVLNNKGVALMHAGRLKEAEATFLRGIDLFPTHIKNRFNLGLVYEKQNRSALAARSMREALELQPDYLEARQELYRICASLGFRSPDCR